MQSADLDLLHRIRKGDEIAFEKVFRTYYQSLCIFSNRILHDRSAAEEIVQDIFFYLWERREKLDVAVSLKAYLFKSAYNNSLKFLRHRQIVADYESKVSLQEPKYELQENSAEVGEIIHTIRETLQQVPERTRIIFEMNRNEGLKYQEIADRLNISIKTVEAHMTGILRLFRENLKDYMPFLVFLNFFLG